MYHLPGASSSRYRSLRAYRDSSSVASIFRNSDQSACTISFEEPLDIYPEDYRALLQVIDSFLGLGQRLQKNGEFHQFFAGHDGRD